MCMCINIGGELLKVSAIIIYEKINTIMVNKMFVDKME